MVHVFARSGGRRLTGQIHVSAIRPPTVPELQRCKPMHHGEWQAHELMVVTRHDTLDDPAYSTYARLVETNVGWFEITYMIQAETATLPNGVRRFLDTVRFPRQTRRQGVRVRCRPASPPAR